MAAWSVPQRMSYYAGKTVCGYGYDHTNAVEYKFNSLGFRSDEITDDATLFTVGNSITFGIGLDIKDTYGYQLAQHLNLSYANIAFGCYGHENHQHIPNIDQIAARNNSKDVVIIQINNLARRRTNDVTEFYYNPVWCVSKLIDYFNYTESVLKNTEHYYVHWDELSYDIPNEIMQKLSIYNKFHLDHSLTNHPTFGIKSHYAIAKVLSKLIESKRAQSALHLD